MKNKVKKMENKRIKLDTERPSNTYRMDFRCINCGVIFEYDMQNGTPATAMRGTCPNCKVKSGTPNIGVFKPILLNPVYDEVKQYFR